MVVCLLVGIRLGARAKTEPPASEADQVATAMSVLRRYMERQALAQMQENGSPM